MKVILLEDVKSLGKKDEIVEVNNGYGNNFLIKGGKAIVADNANLARLKANQVKEAERKAEELDEAKKLAEELKGKEYKIQVKIGGNGKMIGSITSAEIADTVEKVSGHKIDKKKIVLKDKINAIGIYDVNVKLHPEVNANIKVEINA